MRSIWFCVDWAGLIAGKPAPTVIDGDKPSCYTPQKPVGAGLPAMASVLCTQSQLFDRLYYRRHPFGLPRRPHRVQVVMRHNLRVVQRD